MTTNANSNNVGNHDNRGITNRSSSINNIFIILVVVVA